MKWPTISACRRPPVYNPAHYSDADGRDDPLRREAERDLSATVPLASVVVRSYGIASRESNAERFQYLSSPSGGLVQPAYDGGSILLQERVEAAETRGASLAIRERLIGAPRPDAEKYGVRTLSTRATAPCLESLSWRAGVNRYIPIVIPTDPDP